MPKYQPPAVVYCDGGVIGPNPSAIGGTWAWCWVDSYGNRYRHAGGVVTPLRLGVEKVTNNVTELLAAVRLLLSLPDDWHGTLWTDSQVTLYRLTRPEAGMTGVPERLAELLREVLKGKSMNVVLCGGHPTKEELRGGFRKRNGLPVSRHNVFCDHLCNRAAANFKL